MLDTHERKKIPSFSHTSKADVTFFTRSETETPNTGSDGGGFARLSQHRGLDDDLGALDVLLALHHPQLQLGGAGFHAFPRLGCRTSRALTTGPGRGGGGESFRISLFLPFAFGVSPQRSSECSSQQGWTCCPSPALKAPARETVGASALHDTAPHLCPPACLPGPPFAHLMVRCRTWCMADTVFSQATCREGRMLSTAHTGHSAPQPPCCPNGHCPPTGHRLHDPPTRRAKQRGLCTKQTTGNCQDCLARSRCLIRILRMNLL